MAKIVKLTPRHLSEELARYEREFGLSSAEFLVKYQAGEMGDSESVMHWAYLCSVAVRRGVLAVAIVRA